MILVADQQPFLEVVVSENLQLLPVFDEEMKQFNSNFLKITTGFFNQNFGGKQIFISKTLHNRIILNNISTIIAGQPTLSDS